MEFSPPDAAQASFGGASLSIQNRSKPISILRIRPDEHYTRAMNAMKTLLTAEEFDNYPFEEDKRYELDEGELIEMTRPAYKHNRAMQNLLVELVLYFRKNPLGE